MYTPIMALDANGYRAWYTGKAGLLFVDADQKNAFMGFSLEGARRKATVLNRMTAMHGWYFVAVAA